MSNNTYNVRRPMTTNLYDGWGSGAYDSYEPSAFSGSFAALRPHSDRSDGVLGPILWQTSGEGIMPPLGYARFPLQPHIPAGLLVHDVGRRRGLATTSARPRINQNVQNPGAEGNLGLSERDQKEVLKKLRIEIYKPKEDYSNPAKIISRVGQYYKGNLSSNIYDEGSSRSSNNREKCVICLEEFETREEIAITPCNHMFHEDCIVPWAKRHGKCPVCRFTFCEKPEANQFSSNNSGNSRNDEGSSDLLLSGLMSSIRAMDEAFFWEGFNNY